ncbi:MAG: iron ABC transporter permease [Mesorhizobium sp.]
MHTVTVPRHRGRTLFGGLQVSPILLLIITVALLGLLFLVCLPMYRLIAFSLSDVDTGDFTLGNYREAFSHRRYFDAYLTTMLLGCTSVFLAALWALPMAWVIARTNMPGKNLVYVLVLCTFVVPPYLGAISWILLAGENAGWINVIAQKFFGVGSVVNIFSFWGLSFVISLYSFPFVFIMTRSALFSISSEIEEAASILGSGPLKTARRITLPLVLPAILAGCIVTYLEAISLYGSPSFLALPARLGVVTTQLWEFFNPPTRAEAAAAYSMPLVLMAIVLFLIQSWITKRKSYVSVTGKGGRHQLIDLGAFRWVAFLYCLVVLSMSFILPALVLSQAAFSRAWGLGMSVANFTFGNFKYVLFEHSTVPGAILNTFVYSALAGVLAVIIGGLCGTLVVRRLVPGAALIAGICMTPFVVPGIVLGIGFYAAYTTPPLNLYGTSMILIFAFAARFLPIAFLGSSAAIRSVNPEMEEAAQILGASRGLIIRKILLPITKASLASAWLLIFISATRELSTAIFLSSSSTRVMSIMLFDLSEEGNLEYLSALGIVMIAITIALIVVGKLSFGREFLMGKGTS